MTDKQLSAGEVGLEVVGYTAQQDIDWQGDCALRKAPMLDYSIPLVRLSDAKRLMAERDARIEALTEYAAAVERSADKAEQELDQLRALLAAQPQASAAQSAPGEQPAPYGWVAAGQFFTAREDAADAAGKTPCIEVYSRPQMLAILARSAERQALAEELARLLKQSGDELRALKSAPAGELWAVHAQGPDDLYAAFSREDAERHASELNAIPAPEGVRVSAVVIQSPWSPAEHWQYLAEQEREHCDELMTSWQRTQSGVPECFKQLLHHAHGLTMGVDWNKGTQAGHHREPLGEAVVQCQSWLAAAPAQPAAQGYVIVPVDPTPKMLVAYMETDGAVKRWKAMVAAAKAEGVHV